MATVKMIRGSKVADIFDSPETIAQAEKDGYVFVNEPKKEPVKTEKVAESDDEDAPVSAPKAKRQ